jgi:ribonuclease III
MKNPYRPLEQRIGYSFRRKHRLRMALTHRSYRFENDDEDVDNQRLEFLGDAVLGFTVAAYLYATFPDLPEGELTKLRSRVTSGKSLADLAAACGLGDFLALGKGESQSGGRERPSNLADAMEAVLGAAFLDGGIRGVNRILRRLIVPLIEDLHPSPGHDNPKGHLQELAQSRWRLTPKYRVVREEGPSHGRRFTVEVSLQNTVYGQGSGSNKRTAQAEAARQALLAVIHRESLEPEPEAEKEGVEGSSER